jgi:hypothetical protein
MNNLFDILLRADDVTNEREKNHELSVQIILDHTKKTKRHKFDRVYII